MKEKLLGLFNKIKERLGHAIQEQMESPTTLALMEKFEALSPNGQRAVKIGTVLFISILVFYLPVSNLWDSFDSASSFNDKRANIKALLRLNRDIQNAPQVPIPPSPGSMKQTLNAKLAETGIKEDQVKQNSEISQQKGRIKESGIEIKVEKVTIKQAVDLAYGLEHSAKALKLTTLEILAQKEDPHFYDVHLKLVGYTASSERPPAPPANGKANKNAAPPAPPVPTEGESE